ncbi:MAG: hypothetical protein K9N10_22865 [Deltaproteobacteria bacterium]|nr:hypothetical protein [Deltaproteobacteria bacterium]
MKFVIAKKDLVRMLKIVNHRDLASVAQRKKNQYLRIKAHNMEVELQANGVAMSAPAMITQKGVCFIRYRNLLEVVQSYKKKKIYMAVTPDGLEIEKLSTGSGIWYAIFDDPKVAPESMEDTEIRKAPEPSFISSTAIQDWREMYHRS